MRSRNRPKAILRTLSALSVLLPVGAHAAEGARDLRPNAATTSTRTNTTSTEKKKDNEKPKMDIREFEKALIEKGNPIRESFDTPHNISRDTACCD